MKNLTAFFLVCAIAVLGCKKDDDSEPNFPITLYGESVQVTADTRVYIRGAEIKDAEKISKLIKNYSSYFKAEESLSGIGSTYMTFISKDSATFENSLFRYGIQKSGDQFIMTSAITSISPLPVLPEEIRHHLIKHEHVSSVGNGEYRKDVKIAYGTYKELKVPVFGYLISSGLGGPVAGLSRLGGLIPNEFNESALSRLGANDTIAIKTYLITIKAK